MVLKIYLKRHLCTVGWRRLLYTTSNYRHAPRINYTNIQMISPKLHEQIFKSKTANYDEQTLSSVKEHLEEHKLWGRSSDIVDDVDFPISLQGDNIAEHFTSIAENESRCYFTLAESMSNSFSKTPAMPDKWQFVPGWTKYYEDGSFLSIPVPEEDVLIFDVEVCLSAGNIPVLATALSKKAWYCWVSNCLFESDHVAPETEHVTTKSDHVSPESDDVTPERSHVTPDLLIPFENIAAKRNLVIGHHVAYDRSFIKEQYALKETKTRFLDTLSLHMCVSGVTNQQRNHLNSKDPKPEDWMEVGTTNSLANLYKFYCDKELDKSTKDLFVTGTLDDVKSHFQECVQYCASDVSSTKDVFQVIWPMFLKHAPHPVTFAGMLEMGTSYLPINESWNQYIERCETLYEKTTLEMKELLMTIADEALASLIDEKYKNDPWLCSLDWSIHKTVTKEGIKHTQDEVLQDIHSYINKTIEHLSDKKKRQLVMPGYPKWYRDLCMLPKDVDYKPGPRKISAQTKVTPSLLRMTWDGYPLHHETGHGWGYLVPEQKEMYSRNSDDTALGSLVDAVDIDTGTAKGDNIDQKGINVGIPGFLFYRLPHKDGPKLNVGNPLAKDFLSKIADGTLASDGSFNAKKNIEMNKMLSFWRNGRKRIMSQHTVWNTNGVGAILPQIITAGTVTRRAVETTWLTASNPLHDRIGSELKAMVQAPEGYCLVGADVDSQELWIASILGDSEFSKVHGSTALSWMTLQGNKTERTDLHSRTADTIGTDRNQAKIFNYGRIYGAGQKSAVRLLRQFDYNLSSTEAEKKAEMLYESTKGIKKYKLTLLGKMMAAEMGIKIPGNGLIPYHTFKDILKRSPYTWGTRDNIVDSNQRWTGGSESEMFNKLESIALSDEPRTPVLGCKITNALLPEYVHNHFKTSRVNWVVQSSAVDYLHLLLTCMRWLINKFDIDARFCISLHDEVRYIVNEKDKYRAAFALQISNLLTRSMFSYKLDMHDLPQSVAFFSKVDIDKVWRKEVDFDCITPSNPLGLEKGHGICPGESLDINTLQKKMNGTFL